MVIFTPPRINNHICAVFCIFILLFSLAGCGASPQKDAEKQYSDAVSITLFGVENGIAYYDVVIADSFGWDKAGPTRQCTIAKMTVDDCEKLFAAKTDFPLGATVSSIDIMAQIEGSGNAAFHWSGGGTVKIYTEAGTQNKEYKFSDILE